MTIREMIAKTARERDPKACVALAEVLHFRLGMDYDDIAQRMAREGIDAAAWEALLLEGEESE